MQATTFRSVFALLLSAVLLAGLIGLSALPLAAADEDDESLIGMDALEGLAAGSGGGDPDQPGTGNLDDPLAGDAAGSSAEGGTEVTGSEPGTGEGADPASAGTTSANPMFKLMLELILDDVQAAEAEAQAMGKTLTEAQRSAVAAASVKDLLTFLQESGLLGDVDTREILQQIEAIPADTEE